MKMNPLIHKAHILMHTADKLYYMKSREVRI